MSVYKVHVILSFNYFNPQMAPTAATTGHGNSNSGQYKGPGGYGSTGGYTSGYEAGATDYNKVGAGAGAYAGAPTQTKSGTGVGGTPAGGNPSSTSTDLAANMYSKSHAALSKVNVSINITINLKYSSTILLVKNPFLLNFV